MGMQEEPIEPIDEPITPSIIDNISGLFGVEPKYTTLGTINKRRFSVIAREDIPWLLSVILLGDTSDVNPWKLIEDVYLDLILSTKDGRARRDAIKVLLALNGISVPTSLDQPTPGWVARNVTERGWKRRQEEESKLAGDMY